MRNSTDSGDGPILEARHLTRRVRERNDVKTIVNDVTFSFAPCSIYTIVGPSGAGKSSLLRLLNRLDEPSDGEVRFHGEDTRRYDPCELRRRIGYLFQTPCLFPGTPRDNLVYANDNLDENEIEQLIKQVHLTADMLHRDVEKLSIGERQRVALARLLATDPEFVLLDEPTSALDPSNANAIENLIRNMVAQRRVGAIMVTHEPQQALRMDGVTLLMVNGRLVESGPSEQVINSPQTLEGRAYRSRELR
ncbi:MAG: ATP-binding cassette domain-containing protein [Candidatus Zixiibacteriota bacterium]